MIRAYVITEGKTDIAILKTLLSPSSLVDVEFVGGSGSYAAQSLARTILSVRGRPVALVIDADTMDEQTIQEKRTFLYQILHPAQASVTFEVFTAVPEIEIVFCYDKSIFDRIIGSVSLEADWKLAQTQPRRYLREHIPGYEPLALTILAKLSEQEIEKLRKHPLIRQLDEFLKQATADTVQLEMA